MECTRLLYRICAEKASAPRGGRNFRPANAARGKYYLRREERRMQKALAFILAIVLIYLILAAQFESFVQPLIVLLEIPRNAVCASLPL